MSERKKAGVGITSSLDERDAPGALFVFEGPDGVGKSTVLAEVHRVVSAESSRPVTSLAFPGRQPGTLGRHVYALHHDPARFDVTAMTPASLQLLHVAAHVDAIDTLIRPRVARGEIVLLDRYWWSTWVYGVTSGADLETLRAMIEVERGHWRDLQPAVVFLFRRAATAHPEESRASFRRRSAEYAALAAREAASTPVVTVDNDRAVNDAVRVIIDVIRQTFPSAMRS